MSPSAGNAALGGRPPVSMIAWSSVEGRSSEIGAALGGDSRSFYDLEIVDRRLVPARYLLSAARTVRYLITRRPRAVIATNPPVVPGLLAWAYGKLTGARVMLDSHPSSFDPNVHGQLARQLPLHRWLTRRVAGTIVTGPELAQQVRDWGGRPIVFHEAPPTWTVPAPGPVADPPRVLVLGGLAADEPLAETLAAAGQLPGVEFRITGDPRRCPPGLVESAPANVRFTGYLRGQDYVQALADSDIVLSLTKRSEAVSRATYEAVYALRPVVTSQSELTEGLFPYALRVTNDTPSIAWGVRGAIARHAELAAAAPEARDLQLRRVKRQLIDLGVLLGLDPFNSPSETEPTLSSTASIGGLG